MRISFLKQQCKSDARGDVVSGRDLVAVISLLDGVVASAARNGRLGSGKA